MWEMLLTNRPPTMQLVLYCNVSCHSTTNVIATQSTGPNHWKPPSTSPCHNDSMTPNPLDNKDNNILWRQTHLTIKITMLATLETLVGRSTSVPAADPRPLQGPSSSCSFHLWGSTSPVSAGRVQCCREWRCRTVTHDEPSTTSACTRAAWSTCSTHEPRTWAPRCCDAWRTSSCSSHTDTHTVQSRLLMSIVHEPTLPQFNIPASYVQSP